MWHGFYPFYYIMLFFCAVSIELAKDIYRAKFLFRFIPDPFGHIIANLLTMFVLNYLGVAFNCLSFERGFNFGKGTCFLIFIGLPVALFLEKSIGLVRIAKKLEAKKTKKGDQDAKKDK